MQLLRRLTDTLSHRWKMSSWLPTGFSALGALLVVVGLSLCLGVAQVQRRVDRYAASHSHSDAWSLGWSVLLLLCAGGVGIALIRGLLLRLSGQVNGQRALEADFARLTAESQALLASLTESRQLGGRALALAERHFESLHKTVHSAREQADRAAANIEEVSVSIAQLADSAQEAQRLTQLSLSEAGRGQQVVAAAGREIQSAADTFSQTVETVRSLSQRSSEIGGLVSLIKDIADQTKVLSLNAGIEAARAGKNGRGFAVVAEEVRRLAERTAQSTRQVAKIVDGIQRETLRAVSSMQAAHEQVGVGRELSQQAAQALQRIHGGASQSLATVEQIADATRELKGASLQIAGHLGSLAVGTRKTDKTVQRATKEILGELSQFQQSSSPSQGQPPTDPLPSVSIEALASKP